MSRATAATAKGALKGAFPNATAPKTVPNTVSRLSAAGAERASARDRRGADEAAGRKSARLRLVQAEGDAPPAKSKAHTKAAAAMRLVSPVEVVAPDAVAVKTARSRSAAAKSQPKAPKPPARLVAGSATSEARRPGSRLGVQPGRSLAEQAARKRPLSYADRPMEELWREYRAAPSLALKNFFTERFLEIVRYTAERMHKKLPSEVEVDDLISAGHFGLMDAIDAYDPDRGVKFETFCTQRIGGAILDHLRAMDWVPRLVRSRTAKVERARRQIEMRIGRRATDQEVAEHMGVDAIEFSKLGRDSRPVGVVSLSRKWFETDSSKDVREIDVIRDVRQQNPVQLVQRQDLQMLITKGLSRAERLIVVLYYYEEMTMKEIGMTLDLSESRVSQMHTSILARLKAQMQHREREF